MKAMKSMRMMPTTWTCMMQPRNVTTGCTEMILVMISDVDVANEARKTKSKV